MTWLGWWPFPDAYPPRRRGQAVEQPTSPAASSAAPAVITFVVPERKCLDCDVLLDKHQHGQRCPTCTLDDEALNALDGAYWDLFHVIRYGRLLNHSPEGRVYLHLITDACHGALVYAHRTVES